MHTLLAWNARTTRPERESQQNVTAKEQELQKNYSVATAFTKRAIPNGTGDKYNNLHESTRGECKADALLVQFLGSVIT